ncbi:MAG: PilT/PilU family type 4a pilus ATPase [Pseudomonadota bacterium]|jgi:twitching motility protein PilU|uniref:Tfp pilus assembly protein, ATPase PilU n=4 Tax=Methylophaga TaxID=40222 RepID=F5T283_9GAMM|nr:MULTISPECIES: PilT/PilU family type 4a pilus ATPase [Methylophaga]MEC9411508.1 PilT/PilU family type 4a pilus ATPase [Pseudomonadota bacterium]EGL53719.1 tfp pilus assembly protein, ATPase PilU [Methylophaga aminisulfidivorans MP]WVI85109.1 PilT/PilU family type 4a pilus ATPase [Methylophaga thalassica]GLQ00204.1 twitching motility protein PilU [Methylophaga thalassica]HIM38552.1 PilT/PilU family type 4a pilus ATPase [Methylophaga aminisulfidivorans]
MEIVTILKAAVKHDASDVFITAGRPVTLKVNGRMATLSQEALQDDEARDLVLSTMSDAQKKTFEREKECNYALETKGAGRFRISALYQRNKIAMVMRRIKDEIPTIEEIHVPQVIKELSMTKRGLVIFVGATGSGKSTTLAAMIGYRNQNSTGHILTIEDPIEFDHKHAGCVVTQREVGIDTDSYEVALRNSLRQAPDVIMIGEIRTRETMDYGVAFAETGHLCLSTLHANNANQAMDRIINFFPEERHQQLFLDLSLNLKAVIAQRLIPKKDGSGRAVAVEVLLNTPLIADLIEKGKIYEIKEVMKRSKELGMQTFDQAVYDLYKAGDISYEEALRNADSANEVRLMIKLGMESGELAKDSSVSSLSLQAEPEDVIGRM